MINYFAKHPTAANLMMVACLILGLFFLSQLKRETMPEFSSETLQITAAYPGATAEEIEEAIALPIEEALAQISGIKSISTSAMEGSVSVRVTMADGADWQQFTNDIKTKVKQTFVFARF